MLTFYSMHLKDSSDALISNLTHQSVRYCIPNIILTVFVEGKIQMKYLPILFANSDSTRGTSNYSNCFHCIFLLLVFDEPF